jgi:hypothetical protein
VVASAACTELINLPIFLVSSINDIANLWNHNKKFKLVNMVHAALIRGIWLMRNDMCFNRVIWPGMRALWRKVAYMLAQWEVLLPAGE